MSEIAGRVLMIPKGTYSPTTTYDPLDAVNYEHNSYVCKQTSRGNLPTNTTYWQPLTDVTADEIPTEGSTNLVQSGGVYSANQTLTNQVKDMNNVLGAKNLLPTPYYATNRSTASVSTLTVTENSDGSITVSGSTSSRTYIELVRNKAILPIGNYILSGGKSVKQYLYINAVNNGTYVKTIVFTKTNEAAFTIDYNGYDTISIGIDIESGESLSDVTFYPMIRLASDMDDSYVPYAKTNRELTDDTASVIANVPNGAINLAKPISARTTTVNDVEFVIDSEGKVTANGTASANIRFDMAEVTLKAGRTYKICEPSSLQARRPLDPETYRCYARIKSTSEWVLQNNGYRGSYTPTEDVVVSVGIAIQSGNEVTDEIFAPMIVLVGTDVGDTFYPYAKTNKELTDDVIRLDGEVIKIVANGIMNANSSRSFTCTDYEGYRLSIYSIGGNSIGMIVLFGKHPSVSDVRFSKFNCENRNPDAPQISVSGSTLTITTTTFNCYFVIERIF